MKIVENNRNDELAIEEDLVETVIKHKDITKQLKEEFFNSVQSSEQDEGKIAKYDLLMKE